MGLRKTVFSGTELPGVKVAEMAIVPMAGGVFAEACCTALPPAGSADQVLALALVTYTVDGLPEVRDLAVYADPQSFFQPRFGGNVCKTACKTFQISGVISVQ